MTFVNKTDSDKAEQDAGPHLRSNLIDTQDYIPAIFLMLTELFAYIRT